MRVFSSAARSPMTSQGKASHWPLRIGLIGLCVVCLALLLHAGPAWMVWCALLPAIGLGLEMSR
ncbi:hypothetical protein [Oleiagrimonas sp. MCCC 1A03011]|nr:hypothetical protein [Oleiagrimonas sp. MCCC 1A03011]